MDWDWHETRTGDRVSEWEREDGHATVRVRRRPDGRYAVRYDRLFQAPEGSDYRQEVVADRESAVELAARWREEGGGDADGADRGDDEAHESDEDASDDDGGGESGDEEAATGE